MGEKARCAALLASAFALTPLPGEAALGPEGPLKLATGWQLQSSAKLPAGGEALSVPGYDAAGWSAVTVPNTVVGALVENGTYPDPYFGTNLRSIPGTTYPIGARFALLPTPASSPFKPSWWYRTEFDLPARMAGRTVFLRFHGINYRASLWLNGSLVAGPGELVGTFRRYELDVTAYVAQAKAAGRHVVSLALRNDARSSPSDRFNSKEAGTNGPELVVVP